MRKLLFLLLLPTLLFGQITKTQVQTSINNNVVSPLAPTRLWLPYTALNNFTNQADSTAKVAAAYGPHVGLYPPVSRTFTAGTGLTGGGDFSANRTISANFGTASGTIMQGNDSRANNGQTAFGWGNHASQSYAVANGTNTQYIAGDGTKITFPTIPTSSDYITTAGNQTGLTGDKSTSGKWDFTAPFSTGQATFGSTGQGGKINFLNGTNGGTSLTLGTSTSTSGEGQLISTSAAGLTIRNSGASGMLNLEATGTSSYLNFLSANTQTMRMQNGRVRIGTTTTDDASSTLRVDGVVTVAGNILPEANGTRSIGSSSNQYSSVNATSFVSNAGMSIDKAVGNSLQFRNGTSSSVLGGFHITSGNFYSQSPGTAPSDDGSGAQFKHSISAASGIARGVNITPTLTATANNDVLVGVDVNPTFTNGAFTGVQNAGLRVTGHIFPSAAGAYNLGTGSLPFGNILSSATIFGSTVRGFASTLTLGSNSTNAMQMTSSGRVIVQNGGTFTDDGVNQLQVNGSMRLTGTKTHSNASSIVMHNLSTETTNTEYVSIGYSGNVFNITGNNTGTGVARAFNIVGAGSPSYFGSIGSTMRTGQADAQGMFNFSRNLVVGAIPVVGISGTKTNSSGVSLELSLIPTINQTSTAGYYGLFISPYQQAVGTGVKKLISAGVNSGANASGTHDPKFEVDNQGTTFIGGGIKFAPITTAAASLTITGSSVAYVFTGTTSTWTLEAIATSPGAEVKLMNRGSGTVTLNTNGAANTIYDNTVLKNTLSIAAGDNYTLYNDGTYWFVE